MDDALHEILLGDGVTAGHNLFEDAGKDDLLVGLHVDVVELREADEVGAHQDPELEPLLLLPALLPGVTLVLHANPQLVHLGKVQQDEVDRVVNLKRVSMLFMSHQIAFQP